MAQTGSNETFNRHVAWQPVEKLDFGCGLSVSPISASSNLDKSCDLPAVRTL
jgi:hypothetical protein